MCEALPTPLYRAPALDVSRRKSSNKRKPTDNRCAPHLSETTSSCTLDEIFEFFPPRHRSSMYFPVLKGEYAAFGTNNSCCLPRELALSRINSTIYSARNSSPRPSTCGQISEGFGAARRAPSSAPSVVNALARHLGAVCVKTIARGLSLAHRVVRRGQKGVTRFFVRRGCPLV